MRAYRITPGGGVDGLRPVELPDPRPGPGEVLVRVRATSLNYRDLMLARRSEQPIVPLSDGAGEVVELGPGVSELAVGDRVTGCFFPNWADGDIRLEYTREALGGGARNGMLAERVVLATTGLVRTPAHMSDDEAATLPCAALTAWNSMFEQARLRPGQSVLLLGTGGVSIAGLQLAQLAGVRSIITSSSNEKLERARALGADATVNYREHPDWERTVRELTDGRGVDAVLEVGGEGTFAKSMTATRLGGHVAIIGALAHEEADAGGVPLVGRNIRATRISVGSRAMFEDMNRALSLRAVHPVVDRVFGFEDVPAAYAMLESQAHFGKVVIRV
ncbi:MAG: NAD(P)-dependent alcohol dehydrogenase [Dehalococcoidia bacterium]|nr:NAD(P)-dependent alcohol dehydrogenase [Dehalococcoidia bacterium]